jgi:hypothetical protein
MAKGDFALSVGGEFCKIVWNSEARNLGRKLANGPKMVHDASVLIAHRMAPQVANHMKTNAPWTDRTGNARNGLAAQPYDEGDAVGIVLYHQVSYGIWLEVRWGGRYAIINPTIDVMGPRVMSQYNNLLARL